MLFTVAGFSREGLDFKDFTSDVLPEVWFYMIFDVLPDFLILACDLVSFCRSDCGSGATSYADGNEASTSKLLRPLMSTLF